MIQGLYAAASGMMAVEDRQAVIANNIANALTPGFKRQMAVQVGFYELFAGERAHPQRFDHDDAPGGGLKMSETFSDYSNGIARHTGNALDIALVGPGFITLATPNGNMLTRNGRLSVGKEGQLATGDGDTVLSVDGDSIEVAGGGLIEIDENGQVKVDGELRGQIGILEFENLGMLTRSGNSLYEASASMMNTARPAELTRVLSESLEMSNVQLPTEVAHMMLALRAYAANQRVISSIDETVSRLIDQVGAPS
jgi:flagellar basal-body rod protein FlgF